MIVQSLATVDSTTYDLYIDVYKRQGLERLAVVMQDVDSVFDIDTMKAIRDKICEMSGKKYEVDAMDDAVSYTHLDVYKRQVHNSSPRNPFLSY